MLITTQESVAGYEISEVLGLVKGNTVRARHIGRDIMAGLKNIVGGEITEYSRLLAESRDEAIERMEKEATRMGADAVVAVRFETSDVMEAAAELFVYGTAVKFAAE